MMEKNRMLPLIIFYARKFLNLLKFMLVFLFIILFLLFIFDMGLGVNRSSSLPFQVFLSKKINEIKKGEYALFVHPLYEYDLAKQIIATEGDEISIWENLLFINDVSFGEIQSHNSSGKLLEPISQGVIPKGYIFAYGTNKLSFDSRYKEFGLVKQEWIREKLWPIF